VILGSGCASFDVQKPTAAYRSVQIADLTPQGFTADFELDVTNPNAFSIPVTAADYKIALAGTQVADGRTEPPGGSLPAGKTAPVRVPVRLRFDQLLRAERAITASTRAGGDIPYRFEGALEFSAGRLPLSGPVRVPLEFSGTLPLRQVLQQVVSDPRFLTSPDALRLARTVLGGDIFRAVPALDQALKDAGIER
jgi:LEA14-like dessication related protein